MSIVVSGRRLIDEVPAGEDLFVVLLEGAADDSATIVAISRLGREVLRLTQRPLHVEELTDALVVAYGAPSDNPVDDVRALVDVLREQGLVDVEEPA